nr:unnamed protein product [Callosobruchus analis]
MGSSVKAANMPVYLRKMLMVVFRKLPQRVLWKYESDDDMTDLPSNVLLDRWLPQQDILGHPKLKAFVTHGGLLSMFEAVYHAVPIITMPVFCDHDSNAAKAETDGYALKLDLTTLTAEKLLLAIRKIIQDPKYRQEVEKRQRLLLDQPETPLERAIFWTEYVLRHKGAMALQSPSRHFGILQYYLVDVIALLVLSVLAFYYAMKLLLKLVNNYAVHSYVSDDCAHSKVE